MTVFHSVSEADGEYGCINTCRSAPLQVRQHYLIDSGWELESGVDSLGDALAGILV